MGRFKKNIFTGVILCVVLLLAATAYSAIVRWDTREHTLMPAMTNAPKQLAYKVFFEPSLAGGSGSNDFIIGPFSAINLPIKPKTVSILLRAQPHDYTTNDDIASYLHLEVSGGAFTGYPGSINWANSGAGDSMYVKIDSVAVSSTNDSIYPGHANVNGGNPIIFDLPEGCLDYQFFWDTASGCDSLKFIEMLISVSE